MSVMWQAHVCVCVCVCVCSTKHTFGTRCNTDLFQSLLDLQLFELFETSELLLLLELALLLALLLSVALPFSSLGFSVRPHQSMILNLIASDGY
jgi:hypothetical protein